VVEGILRMLRMVVDLIVAYSLAEELKHLKTGN
jgi:hypothetical protein